MKTQREDDSQALGKALDAIQRNPKQEKLHRAVTDMRDPGAVDDLRGLVHGDFGRINDSTEKATEEPGSIAPTAKTELSPEQVKEWLGSFKARFDAAPHLHEGMQFADVEKALRADPDAMRAFAELDKNGHETNVFGEDATHFEIGTCSLEAASGHRNIVFDRAAQDLLGEGEKCDGNAVDIAATVGVDLMDEDQIIRLKNKLRKNQQLLNNDSWDWFKKGRATKKYGIPLDPRCADNFVYLYPGKDHDVNGSFRAVRRVKKLAL